MSDVFPDSVGAYELLVPIGVGGMGRVFLAQREIVAGVSRKYAIKLLHPQLMTDAAVVEQLVDEARAAATVRHPNVVEVVEAVIDDAGAFLVMQYVEGDTLGGLMRAAQRASRPIPLPIVGRVLLDAISGLRAAHEARADDGHALELIHRDFSPQNLLVGVDGVTRLTDFGIARAVGRTTNTATGIVKGKVRYMAPEQALGKPLDGRCDLWAAGVVLWEAVANRRLFKDDNDAQVVLELVSGAAPPPVSSFRRGVPPELDDLLSRALERDPGRRIATAAELCERLEKALRGGIATHDEVGAHVREVASDLLTDRALQVAERARRAGVGGAGGAPESAAAATGDAAGHAGGGEGTRTGVVTTTKYAMASPSRSRLVWLLATLVLGGAALALAVPRWRAAPDRAAAASAWAPPPSSSAAPAPEPAAEPPPPAAPEPTDTVLVESDVPIVQLRVDDAAPLVLPDPVKTLRVPASDATQRLVARDRHGREQTAAVSPGQRSVSLRFGPEPKPRPPPKARPRPRGSDDDRLAPGP